MAVLDDIVVMVACQECGREARRSVGWLKSRKEVMCAGCAAEVEFDTGQLAKAAEKAQTAVNSIMDRTRDSPRAS